MSTAPKTTTNMLNCYYVCVQEEALAVTGQTGAQAAAQWVLNRPKSSTQWSIVKQGSSGSVLCSRQSPAVYNQSALEVWLCHASISCTAELTMLITHLFACWHQACCCTSHLLADHDCPRDLQNLKCGSRYGPKHMLHKQKICAICALLLYPACQLQGNLVTVEVHVGASR